MRLYYLRHGSEIPDGHMAHNSAVLAYKGLSQRYLPSEVHDAMDEDSISTEEARSTLILAAKGLADQGKNYYLPRALFTIVENEMVSMDKNALRQFVTVQEDDKESLQERQEYISSRYPVGEWTVRDEKSTRRLDILVKEYLELAGERFQGFNTSSSSSSNPRSGSSLSPRN
jgi:hypothetical protein